MDILTYLENYEPNNLKKICAGTYCTREHDSLKISNGVWYWFSRHVGGKNALDYLIKVKGVSFTQAVETLTGYAQVLPPVYARQEHKHDAKEFKLPERNEDVYLVRRYLRLRGIDDAVIDYCVTHGLIYEDKKYHNCIFLGYDDGVPKYGAVRGTGSDYKIDLPGSDKRFAFSISAERDSDTVHLFEAVIDLLSYATLEIKEHRNWRKEDMLSLAGVYKTDNKQDVPLALKTFLERHPIIKTICLHLDNDDIGRTATEQIISSLSDKYTVLDMPPKCGKDYNDYLQNELQKTKRKDMER